MGLTPTTPKLMAGRVYIGVSGAGCQVGSATGSGANGLRGGLERV
jgi:hypothetical protein